MDKVGGRGQQIAYRPGLSPPTRVYCRLDRRAGSVLRRVLLAVPRSPDREATQCNARWLWNRRGGAAQCS